MENIIDIDRVIEAGQQGQWLVFAGLLLAGLVQIAHKLLPLWKNVPKRAKPWIVMVLAVLAAGGGVLGAGGSWIVAIIVGVGVGLSALGVYDLAKGPLEALMKRFGGAEKTPAEGKEE